MDATHIRTPVILDRPVYTDKNITPVYSNATPEPE